MAGGVGDALCVREHCAGRRWGVCMMLWHSPAAPSTMDDLLYAHTSACLVLRTVCCISPGLTCVYLYCRR